MRRQKPKAHRDRSWDPTPDYYEAIDAHVNRFGGTWGLLKWAAVAGLVGLSLTLVMA